MAFDFNNNTVNIGDIPVDVEIEGSLVSFESLLKVSGNFSPVTFAASTALKVFTDLFNAAKERKLLRQQIDLLNDIRHQLDALNQTATAILHALNALPVTIQNIVRDERLNDHYALIESNIQKFVSNPAHRVFPQDLENIHDEFFALAEAETRISNIAKFVHYVEFMNFIDKGESQEFLRSCLRKRIEFLHLLMNDLVKKFATRYFTLTSELSTDYINFTTRPMEIDNLTDEGTYFNGLAPARARLRVGEGPGQFDDVQLEYTPFTPEEVTQQFSNTKLTYASKPNFSFDMHAAMVRCRDVQHIDSGPPECRNYQSNLSGGFQEYWRRERLMQAAYDAFRHAVPEIKEDIARFAELEGLKHALEQCAAFDYVTKLRDAEDHIRRN